MSSHKVEAQFCPQCLVIQHGKIGDAALTQTYHDLRCRELSCHCPFAMVAVRGVLQPDAREGLQVNLSLPFTHLPTAAIPR